MNISQHALDEIASRCHEETRKFLLRASYTTDDCMELMRRALLRRTPEAFTKLYEIYEPLVRTWVYQHHQFNLSGEDADYFVNAALTRFYFAVSESKFAQFESLAQLLQYLKRCVYTTIALYMRSASVQVAAVPFPSDDVAPATQPDWDARIRAESLWERVCALLPDEDDQLLARLVFIEGMKPAAILAEIPGRWPDARAISVKLQRIRRRLRGDEVIQSWVDDNSDSGT